MKNPFLFFLSLLVLFSSCAVQKGAYNKKYAAAQLRADYDLFQNIIEESHPGLYWYTPKDSMDHYFETGRTMLQDSMTELQFRTTLSYVIAKLRCGHTSVRSSKSFARSRDSLRNRQFPLGFKIWKDTAFVTQNLNRKDSFIKRGMLVTAIDGLPMQKIVDSLFEYLPADGYNLTHKYQSLSNRGTFGSLYFAVFGIKSKYEITFIDSTGVEKNSFISIYTPAKDSSTRIGGRRPQPQKPSRRERRKFQMLNSRNMQVDTALNTAFMGLHTFLQNGRLRSFFRSSFKQLNKRNIKNLVIDLRSNGGGSVTNSNLLTKYISDHPFRVADSLYTKTRSSKWGRYQEKRFPNWLFTLFTTRKRTDGNYHFGYYERKTFKPKKKHHFNGPVYVLSGGNTFSASTLFIQAVKHQPNVTIVGEESGGGAYGNNAWLIPDVTLPVTKVRFRLPLFRLVIDKDEWKGFGAQPEVLSLPTTEAIRKNQDFKTEKAIELIKASGKY